MKKKTLSNIILCAVILLFVAGAVFFAGRRLGWFDSETAVSAAVRKGTALWTRGGIATQLQGETSLRSGDELTVTSGTTRLQMGTSELLLSPSARVEILSADSIRIAEGEAFCRGSDSAVTLLWGEHSLTLQNAAAVCSADKVYILGGQAEDALPTGKMISYQGNERLTADFTPEDLSEFALECISERDEGLLFTRTQAADALTARTAPNPPSSDRSGCTVEIRCDTILQNIKDLEAGLDVYVPDNGIILPAVSVSFTAGETAFDALKRVCKEKNIPLEYSWTPLYESYYIEGINHLYEFSCGSESGWMYQVNGQFPNYGCSSYKLQEGDVIIWHYTCKGLGADVGAGTMN